VGGRRNLISRQLAPLKNPFPALAGLAAGTLSLCGYSVIISNFSFLFPHLQSKSMDTQLVYPFRSSRRNSERCRRHHRRRRRRRVKNFRGVAIRKHRGIGELDAARCSDHVERDRRKNRSRSETLQTGNCVNLFRETDTLLTLFDAK
jgi:hypothetical protein